jgi:DNA-binding NarL/FixJ family response regulator
MAEKEQLTLVIINDHQLLTDLLVEILKGRGFGSIKTFTDVNFGMADILSHLPDMVIIDMMLPNFRTLKREKVDVYHPYILMDIQTSLRVVKHIRLKCSTTKVLMLTGERHPHTFLLGFAAGAHGIVSKLDNLHCFEEVLHRVMAGESTSTSERMQRIIEEYKTTPGTTLTPFETQILEFVQEGLEAPEIGRRLGYAPKTIRNIMSRINNKLGTRNRFEALELAIEIGLVGWRMGCEEN